MSTLVPCANGDEAELAAARLAASAPRSAAMEAGSEKGERAWKVR
jgi:hypothetical protein